MGDWRQLASGLGFPEGPIACADGSVLLVEIETGWITRVAADGGVDRLIKTGGGPNGMAFGPDGMLYVCNNGGFRWREWNGMRLFVVRSFGTFSGVNQRSVGLIWGLMFKRRVCGVASADVRW